MDLCTAIISGSVDHVRHVIEVGKADVNTTVIMSSHGITVEPVNTPLTLAVQLGRLDVIQLLLDKGANVNQPNSEGLTPITMAATGFRTESHKPNEEIFRLILEQAGQSIGRQSQIDAFELIGATYFKNSTTNSGFSFERGMFYWRKAMALRYDVEPVMPKTAVAGLSECARKAFAVSEIDTLEELENLSFFYDNDTFKVQALLTSYRILGGSNCWTWLLLSSYAVFCWKLDNRQRFIDYNMLTLECSLLVEDPLVFESAHMIRRLTLAFYFLITEESNSDIQLVSFANVMPVLSTTFRLLKMNSIYRSELLDCVVQLTILLTSMDLTPEQNFQFKSCLYQLVRLEESFDASSGRNLLLTACSSTSPSFRRAFLSRENLRLGFHHCGKLPSAKVIRVLLEVGADPDSTDMAGNTGLHLLIKSGERESSTAVRTLFQAGTHVDQTNKDGETMTDLLYKDYTPRICEENTILVNPLQFPSLKCLCARAVRRYGNLPDDARHRLVPSDLFDFIQLH